MSQYRRPSAEQSGALVGDARTCSACGHLVTKGDEYCSGCGVSFSPVVEPDVADRTLPGFNYHFMQAFGWGLGFALASATVAAIVFLVLLVAGLLAQHR